MLQSEKPKRKPHLETEADIKRAYQDFYGRLLLILLIPACALGSLFMLPVIIFNNMPDYNASYFDVCNVSEGNRTVRIISETTLVNTTIYSWRVENNRWQDILTVETDYRRAVDCEAVIFYGDSIIVYKGQNIGVLDGAREVSSWQFPECDSVETVAVVDSMLNIRCKNGREFSINDTIVWDN